MLPPKKEDLDSVLAFIFVGPTNPVPKDLKRTPLLVRKNKVLDALEWLKLNHLDYKDMTISKDNLDEYNENEPPVEIDYRPLAPGANNKNPESQAVNEDDNDIGVSEGECPFTVHGLTGAELDTLSLTSLKLKALHHLATNGKVLAVGH